MRRLALVLVPVLALAGCLGSVAAPDACPAPELTLLAGPREEGTLARAPGEPVPLLYWARNPHGFNASLFGTTLPAPEGALDPRDPDAIPDTAGIHHEVSPRGIAFAGYRAPVPDDAGELVFQVDLSPSRDDPASPDCGMTGVDFETLALAAPVGRDAASAGMGVLVRTGGFWTNGTSFYTNHAGVHEESGIPKGYLGEYGGDEPLKVYVYGEGETVPPKRYQDAGFGMTIRGFNAALGGLPNGTARLAWLAPEEAYTREGAEAHPLYGEALLFWIEVDEVVDLPCPLPQPQCDLPGVPRLPIPPLPPVPPLR